MIKLVAVAFVVGSSLSAQVPSPKAESRWHHIAGPHRDDANALESRYTSLACALVVIRSENRIGTGFYVSADGEVVTASHVLGDREFEQAGQQVRIRLHMPTALLVRNAREEFSVPAANVENDANQWSVDLARFNTGRPATCWLRIGDDKLSKPGERVIALGFPGLAFGSLSLYSGIISARVRSNLVTGFTAQGQAVTGANELIHVQMPISPGISGGPIIDDENRAIAVVTTAGAWSPQLEALTQLQRMGALRPGPPNTVDLAAAVAQLAGIFHDYASPGYGDAVPLSYLGPRPTPLPQQPASRDH